MFADWRLRFRALFRRAVVERDIDDELRFHFDRQVESFMAKGLSKAEAVRRARLEFGAVAQVKDEYRDALGIRLVDDLSRDLRYVFRTLSKTPAFSAVAISTLALAVAANSAIFSAVYAVLLKPLPLSDVGNLVVLWATDASRNRPVVELSYRNIQDWQTETRSFVDIAAMGSSNWTAVMYGRGDPARISIAGVTASFFETLGARPFLGRTFRQADDLPNAPGVVVLNHGAWVRRFASDPAVVGTTLTLDQKLYTVVGVMPNGFDFPRNAELWLPVVPVLTASSARWGGDVLADVGVLFGIGRLRNDVSALRASQELNRFVSRSGTPRFPRFGSGVMVTPFLDHFVGPVRRALWMLFAAVAALLSIACANISALMLTRMVLRRREHAVRIALGATRFDLGRLCVLETIVLAFAGGIMGLAISHWIAAAIVRLGPDDVPGLAEASINVPVAAFTFGTVFLSALLCAAGPVRQAGSSDVLDALRDGGHTTPGKTSHRTRSLLLTIQVALAVVLLISATLIARSFVNLRSIDLGFTAQDVVTMNVRPSAAKPPANDWFGELLSRIDALPDVEAAGAVYLPPLALGPIGQGAQVLLDGQADTPQAQRRNPVLNYQVATPGYFRAMGISLVRGRLFDARDDGRSPRVTIVGESTAQQLWPGEDPIGKRLAMPTLTPGDDHDMWRTVVGVVSNVRYRGIDSVSADIYDPAMQAAFAAEHLVLRTQGNPSAAIDAVRAVIRELDARAIVDGVTTMDAVVSRAMAPWRLSAWMFTLFAILAFGLATIGLFSLVSLDVASWKHDFAVRLVLGAVRSDIRRLVLVAAIRQVAVGIPLGLLVALLGSGALESLLFGVRPLDGITYVSVIALVSSVVAVAAYLPARRAAGTDPSTILRSD